MHICIIITGTKEELQETRASNIDGNEYSKGLRMVMPAAAGEVEKMNQKTDESNPFSISKYFPSITKYGNYLNDMVILTSTTSSFIDFTRNWLISIGRLGGSHPKIYIIAEDQETYDKLTRMSFQVDVYVIQAPQSEVNASLQFNSVAYKNFVNKRPRYILDILNSGHDVLFSDVDIVWYHRPYRYFNDESDIYLLQDQGPPDPKIYCAGFAYYRSTKDTIEFVKRWIEEIDSFKEPRPDQVVLNRLIQNKPFIKKKPVPHFKFQELDPNRFVSGHYYFNSTWREQNPEVKPFVLHNNWIVGHDTKVERFQQLGVWFV